MLLHSRVVGTVAGIAAIVASIVGAAPAAAQTTGPLGTPMGAVVIVHGLVDLPADVYLDGSTTAALRGFEFRRVTDPLALPVGTHRAELRKAGDAPTAAPVLSGSFTVVADQRITVAAVPDSSGTPSWLAFPDDARVVEAGKGELRFRHVAAASPVVVTIDGAVVLDGVSNLASSGQAVPVRIDPGVHRIGVLDAAGQPVVPAQDVSIAAGSLVNVYLTGAISSGLALMQEPIAAPNLEVLQTMPSQVPSGNSGLAATPEAGSSPLATAAIAAGAALAVALLTAALITASLIGHGRLVPARVPLRARRP